MPRHLVIPLALAALALAPALGVARQEKQRQVQLEIRFITVPTAIKERMERDYANLPCPQPESSRRLTSRAYLTDCQVRQFLEMVQSCPEANVLQAPRLTILNRQFGNVATPELQMSTYPRIAKDRRTITFDMDLQYNLSSASTRNLPQPAMRPLTMRKAVKIPDGRTLLLSGWQRQSEEFTAVTSGPEILKNVPILDRLFITHGYGIRRGTEHVLVLLTPRIVASHEEEVRQTGVAAPLPFGAEECTALPARMPERNEQVARLVKHYYRLCGAGQGQEAGKLARQALALDPECFARYKMTPRRHLVR